jgi:hypothetical protein
MKIYKSCLALNKKLAYTSEVTGAGRLVNAEHQSNKADEVVLDKALIEKSVEHGGREDVAA